MSVEAFLVDRLEDINPRVYRQRLPQGVARPALTYQRIGTVRGYAHSGDDRLPTVRMQVDCWADDPDQVDVLAEAVTEAFTGYSDDFAQRIEVDDDREFDDPDSGLFRRIVDLLITYRWEEGS